MEEVEGGIGRGSGGLGCFMQRAQSMEVVAVDSGWAIDRVQKKMMTNHL